jgi:hypothetical protein
MSIKQKILFLTFTISVLFFMFSSYSNAVGNPGPSQIQNATSAVKETSSKTQTSSQKACDKYDTSKTQSEYQGCLKGYNDGSISKNIDKICTFNDDKKDSACEYGFQAKVTAQKKSAANVGTTAAKTVNSDGVPTQKRSEVCDQSNETLRKSCEKAYDTQAKKTAQKVGAEAGKTGTSFNCNNFASYGGSSAVKACNTAKNGAEDEARGCGGVKTYFNFGCGNSDKEKGGSNSPIIKLLQTIINWMTAIVSTIVVFAIVYGGFLYATAGDRADQQKTAITVITDAVIALILLVLMYSILNFVIPGGIFQ